MKGGQRVGKGSLRVHGVHTDGIAWTEGGGGGSICAIALGGKGIGGGVCEDVVCWMILDVEGIHTIEGVGVDVHMAVGMRMGLRGGAEVAAGLQGAEGMVEVGLAIETLLWAGGEVYGHFAFAGVVVGGGGL